MPFPKAKWNESTGTYFVDDGLNPETIELTREEAKVLADFIHQRENNVLPTEVILGERDY